MRAGLLFRPNRDQMGRVTGGIIYASRPDGGSGAFLFPVRKRLKASATGRVGIYGIAAAAPSAPFFDYPMVFGPSVVSPALTSLIDDDTHFDAIWHIANDASNIIAIGPKRRTPNDIT